MSEPDPPSFTSVVGHIEMPKQELRFTMRQADWERLHDRVSQVDLPTSFFVGAGWAAAGAALTSALALIPWVPARSQLPAQSYAWVTPLLAVATVFFGFVAVLCAFVQRRDRARTGVSRDHVLADMDSIRPLVPTESGSPVIR